MKVSKKFLDPWFYEINELGYNYRASEINCALGLSQLKRLTASIKLRNKIALTYKRELESIDLIKFPDFSFNKKYNAWHLFTILINFKKLGISKRDFINRLESNGIGTQVHYIPLFLQPLYKESDLNSYKGALEYYEKNISLPIYLSLKLKNVVFICDTIKKILNNK